MGLGPGRRPRSGAPGGAGGAAAGAALRRAVAAPGVTFTPGPGGADFDPRPLPAVGTDRSIPGRGGGRRSVGSPGGERRDRLSRGGVVSFGGEQEFVLSRREREGGRPG